MEVLARTSITVWEGGSLWLVDALPNPRPEPRHTDVHAHHAIQVTVSLGGWFRLESAGQRLEGDAVAVAADAPHQFEAEGRFAILFVEPESRAGRAIRRRLFPGTNLAGVSPDLVEAFRAEAATHFAGPDAGAASVEMLGRRFIDTLAGGAASDTPDSRVSRMIAFATRHLEGPVSLADVVPVCGLSAGRLSHLFVEQTGLPFRTYLLWLRLTQAVRTVVGGANLTEAAHQAGFSDSAHFSRTFRRMFGVAPASLRIS